MKTILVIYDTQPIDRIKGNETFTYILMLVNKIINSNNVSLKKELQ